MMWYICLIVALIAVIFGVTVYFKSKKESFRLIALLISLFLATYAIYLPAYILHGNVLGGIFANIVHTLQIVTIDADFAEFSEIIYLGLNSSILNYVYTVMRGILHLGLPLVSAMSALSVLIKCFSSIKLHFANKNKRPMYIFSEYNERSKEFAKSLANVKCDVIFAEVDDNILSNKGESSRNFIYKEESITDLKINKNNEKEVFFLCLTEDEDKALSQTLKIIENFKEKHRDILTNIDSIKDEITEINKQIDKVKKDEQKSEEEKNEIILQYENKIQQLKENINILKKPIEKIHVYHFTKSSDHSIYIDSADKGYLDVNCINEYEIQVQQLLDKYPLFSKAKSKIHVLLHGISELNKIAFKNIFWCGQLAGFELKISIVGIDISNEVENLKYKLPSIFSNYDNIKVYDCKTELEEQEVIKKHCSDANYIIVNGKTDNETMEQGVALRRLFYRIDKSFTNCPPIYCYVSDVSKSNVLKKLATAESNEKKKMSYDLIPFGSISEVYSCDKLLNSDVEKLAKNVHLAYAEIFSDKPIDVKQELENYNLFEVNKRSNRANALHIRYKLRLLGLDYVESDDKGENLSDYYTEEILDKLSRAEHDRWQAFVESEGWIQSHKEEVYAYRKSNISKGRHQCPILKMHPYICEYEALKDLSLDLEGKDTTVYDTELVLRIPDILGDKWNVGKKKFKIVKIESDVKESE